MTIETTKLLVVVSLALSLHRSKTMQAQPATFAARTAVLGGCNDIKWGLNAFPVYVTVLVTVAATHFSSCVANIIQEDVSSSGKPATF